MKKIFLIIDANSLLHRAFWALPFLSTKKGKPTGALYGFLLTLFKVIDQINPSYIVACFDSPKPTFRHQEYQYYKAKRPPTPKDLKEQIRDLKEILKILNIKIFEKEGFEADDLIASLTKTIEKKQVWPKFEIYILSGDLDNLSLVSDNVKIYFLAKGIKNSIIYSKDDVISKMGIMPNQIIDFKALAGDSSDNIPGVTGIGKKGAIFLLKEFGNLENLYEHLEKDTPKAKKIPTRLKEILIKYKEQAFLSKSLAQTKETFFDFQPEDFYWKNFNRKNFLDILKKYEFYSLISRFAQKKLIS